MGQYFRIVNLDKKEWIEPDGWKLWELCANNSIRMLGYLLATDNWDGTNLARLFFSTEQIKQIKAYFKKFGMEFKVVYKKKEKNGEIHGYGVPLTKYFGHWCGDRLAIIGDYANYATNYKPDFPSWSELKENPEWKDITKDVEREFNAFIEVDSLMVGNLKDISPDAIISADYRMVDNSKIKVK